MKRKEEDGLANDTKRLKRGRNDAESKFPMRLALCFECGEYIVSTTAKSEYCFEDHMCEVDTPDFEKFRRCIEIIESKLTLPSVAPQPANLADAQLPPPPTPTPPPATKPKPKPNHDNSKAAEAANASQCSNKKPSHVDELKSVLREKFPENKDDEIYFNTSSISVYHEKRATEKERMEEQTMICR